MAVQDDNWSLTEYRDPKSPKVWVFRKNLAPTVSPGSASHPHVCYLSFNYSPRDETGLPSPEDARRLEAIEMGEIPSLERGNLSVLVGVALKEGVKDFIFYASDPHEFLDRASHIRDAHPEYDLGCEVGPNPDWSHYEDLP